MICVEVRLFLFEFLGLARVNNRYAKPFCESGFKVSSVIVMRKVCYNEACGTNGGAPFDFPVGRKTARYRAHLVNGEPRPIAA
jgi:hypothetical protein